MNKRLVVQWSRAALLTALTLLLSSPAIAQDADAESSSFGYVGVRFGGLADHGWVQPVRSDPWFDKLDQKLPGYGMEAIYLDGGESGGFGFMGSYERIGHEFETDTIFRNSDERLEGTLTQNVVGAAGLYGLTFGPRAAAYGGVGYASTHVKLQGQVAGGEFDGATLTQAVTAFGFPFSSEGGIGRINSWYVVGGIMGGKPKGFGGGVNVSYYGTAGSVTVNVTLGYRF